MDLQQYSLGSCSLLAIQIDAAINPGNSGGPALNKHRQCVGIAFQSLKDGETENIGYIIPSEVSRDGEMLRTFVSVYIHMYILL